jgi:hypothetical protein
MWLDEGLLSVQRVARGPWTLKFENHSYMEHKYSAYVITATSHTSMALA